MVSDELGADLFVITSAQPYSNEDLNCNNVSSRVSIEHNDPDGRHVELETITPEGFDGYDTVLIGYPIWWGEAAWVVDDFVSGNSFDGKTVIPFCTSASSPLGQSGSLLADIGGLGRMARGHAFPLQRVRLRRTHLGAGTAARLNGSHPASGTEALRNQESRRRRQEAKPNRTFSPCLTACLI